MPRILIIGGGIAGIATAWSLAQRGARDVVLLEREDHLCTQASAQNAAVLRTLSSDALTGAFARASADFLFAPPQGFSPVPLVHSSGLLLSADSHGAAELARWFEACGRDCGGAPVARERAHELAPHLDAPIEVAFWFPREGRLDIATLSRAFERGARAGGVAIESGAEVKGLSAANGRVRGVRLASGEELLAEWTALAAGGWAGALGRSAGSRVALTPTRRHLLTTVPHAAVDPVWPVVWHHAQHPFYARPEGGGFLACALDQTVVDPDACRADPAVEELVAERLSRYLPSFAGARTRNFWAGMRTFAADQRFAVGPDPDLAGLFWIAGLGGHGMVCAHGVGELAAARLSGEPARSGPARAFDPSRLVGSLPRGP